MLNLFKRNLVVLFLNCILICAFSQVRAQAISGEDIKSQFTKDWERAKAYTLDYLNTMPADKYSFKAVDSIRSFAQQMLHLATDNVGFVEYASGTKAGYSLQDLEKRPTAQNKDSVVYYVTKSYDFAIQGVKNFDPAKFG